MIYLYIAICVYAAIFTVEKVARLIRNQVPEDNGTTTYQR